MDRRKYLQQESWSLDNELEFYRRGQQIELAEIKNKTNDYATACMYLYEELERIGKADLLPSSFHPYINKCVKWKKANERQEAENGAKQQKLENNKIFIEKLKAHIQQLNSFNNRRAQSINKIMMLSKIKKLGVKSKPVEPKGPPPFKDFKNFLKAVANKPLEGKPIARPSVRKFSDQLLCSNFSSNPFPPLVSTNIFIPFEDKELSVEELKIV